MPSVRPPLRFEILGPPRALRGGQEIDLGPAKQRAVLATLLLHPGRAVPTHRIVDAVWGDDPPENGANVVQKYVAGLRRVLDPDRSPRTPGDLLALTPAGYLLHVGAGALDVEQFTDGLARAAAERTEGRLADASRTLKHALGLWRGAALAGLSGTAFDAARDRLTELHATAWETWAEIELARGNHPALVPDLVRLVADFPLREGLRALLMLALHQGGRQAEALAVFREARRYLDEEFGVEPGELLQDVQRRVLRGDPSLAPPPDDAAIAPVADRRVPAPREPADPFPDDTFRHDTFRDGAVPDGAVRSRPVPHQPVPGGVADHATVPGGWPVPPGAAPPAAPRRSALAVIGAALLPVVTCGVGSWVLVAALGFVRRDLKHMAAAVGYLLLMLVSLVIAGSNPSPVDAPEVTDSEFVGFTGFLLVAVASGVHGTLMAARPRLSAADRRAHRLGRRHHARWLLHAQPETARELGVGRPDLPRWFDDGGLVDVNHAPGHVLATLAGVTPDQAHLIVADRARNGPFDTVDDLVTRGLLPAALAHRISGQLVCVPPASRPAVTET